MEEREEMRMKVKEMLVIFRLVLFNVALLLGFESFVGFG